MKTKSEIFTEAHKLAKTFEGDYKACFVLALSIVREEKETFELDLLSAKRWSPNPNMARFYFDEKYLQVNISKDNAYYKLVGFEGQLSNEDEIRSQLSYWTNIDHKRIYLSKF